jgi:hypothetical protein
MHIPVSYIIILNVLNASVRTYCAKLRVGYRLQTTGYRPTVRSTLA